MGMDFLNAEFGMRNAELNLLATDRLTNFIPNSEFRIPNSEFPKENPDFRRDFFLLT